MATSRSKRGTATVTPEGPVKATKALREAIVALSNARAAIKPLEKDEKDAKEFILDAVDDRAATILDSRGNVICEVVNVPTTSVKVDDFVEALTALYPELESALRDTWPEAVAAAKTAATKHGSHRRVLPK